MKITGRSLVTLLAFSMIEFSGIKGTPAKRGGLFDLAKKSSSLNEELYFRVMPSIENNDMKPFCSFHSFKINQYFKRFSLIDFIDMLIIFLQGVFFI